MPTEHTVKSFDSELQRLYGELRDMGERTVAQLERAGEILLQRDGVAADALIAADVEIDALESEIGQDVLRLLALRQPMARDLREVYSAIKIAADIERVGDLAANVAKRSKVLNQSAVIPATAGLPPLIELAAELVREAIASYLTHNADLAKRIRERDAELDAQYTRLFREVLTYMAEDARMITPCTHLLFIAKNIERIGDHATNIAESTWFVVHGEMFSEARTKRDGTTA
jgi:phosphate transport system protein